MQHAFTALGKASASLFGLVLIALVFALRSAFSTLEEPEDFHEYSNWISMAGVATFLYFGFCFVVAFRLLEDATSTPEVVLITAIFTVLVIAAHGGEMLMLQRLVSRFEECRKLALAQVVLRAGHCRAALLEHASPTSLLLDLHVSCQVI